MRLFIAIELPDDVRRHLVDVQDAVRPALDRASVTKPDNLHLTLKFLGECDARRADALVASLRIVRPTGAVVLRAVGAVCFPPRGPVRIVAAGLAAEGGTLAALQRSIEQRCQFLGFEREGWAYTPHVTLARARPTLPASARASITELTRDRFPGPAFRVGRFVLMESRLVPGGAQYRMVETFPLPAD